MRKRLLCQHSNELTGTTKGRAGRSHPADADRIVQSGSGVEFQLRKAAGIIAGVPPGPCFLAQATLVQAATETGVYVEFRASEEPDAPVVER